MTLLFNCVCHSHMLVRLATLRVHCQASTWLPEKSELSKSQFGNNVCPLALADCPTYN